MNSGTGPTSGRERLPGEVPPLVTTAIYTPNLDFLFGSLECRAVWGGCADKAGNRQLFLMEAEGAGGWAGWAKMRIEWAAWRVVWLN